MRKNLFKKAFASITAFMTVSAMAVSMSAFAEVSKHENDDFAKVLPTSTSTPTISINKDIIPYNPDKRPVFEPNITYKYEITSASVTNATITDSNGNPTAVHPGPLEAIVGTVDGGNSSASMVSESDKKTGTLTFGNDNTITSGTNRGDEVNIDVDEGHRFRKAFGIRINSDYIYNPTSGSAGSQVNGPGVYRYRIEDVTSDAEYTASGITEGSASDKIYLDVYTKYRYDNPTDQNVVGLDVYGYVLFKESTDDGNASITYTTTTTESTEIKITGFDVISEGDYNQDSHVSNGDLKSDTYQTYNLKITKQITGDLADRTNQFPFDITLTNPQITSLADFDVYIKTAILYPTPQHLNATGGWTSTGITLSNNDTVEFIGLPPETRVMVKETNNKEEVYTATVSVDDGAKQLVKGASAAADSVKLEKNESAQLSEAQRVKDKLSKTNIVFTNTLTDVSVTGLIFSVAPFVFITAAGIILLAIYLRSKKKENGDNII